MGFAGCRRLDSLIIKVHGMSLRRKVKALKPKNPFFMRGFLGWEKKFRLELESGK